MNMKDDWVAAALSDDSLVAELLSRLNQSSSQPPKPPSSLCLPFGWGHRQPRSKPKKDSATTTTTRCSPTTPLSWSGGGGAASPSDGDYSNSNSSRPSSDLSRSNKGAYGNDVTNIYANKRSKKKKSFTELKEEESLLLKERVTLKRELASLHVTLKQQRVRSENLKRIKIDLNLQTTGEICTTSCHSEVTFPSMDIQMEASTSDDTRSALPRFAPAHEGFGSPGSCRVIEKEIDTQKGYFALPDLNMMPSEEDIGGPEMVNGMS